MSAPDWRLELHDELPSTQALAAWHAERGAPAGLAVLARRQTAGRGRAARAWNSPAGNLHLSVLLRPGRPARELGPLALLAGVALHSAAAAHAPVRLKWPNDLLLGDAKVAGILAEARIVQDAIGHLLLGFGVNLAEAPSVPGRATAALGAVGPEAFARALLAALGRWLDRHAAEGFAPVRAAWMAAGPAPGAPLALRQGDSTVAGRYEGIAEDGALLLATECGPRRFHAGELDEG